MERQKDSMNRVLMVIPLTVVIKSLINMKLMHNGSDDNSSLLYMCASDQCLKILLYNKVERKVRLIKFEQ